VSGISYRNDEPEIAAPINAHRPLLRSASTNGLVGTVNVAGDFYQVAQLVGYVSHEPSADVFEPESDVLRCAAQSEPKGNGARALLTQAVEAEVVALFSCHGQATDAPTAGASRAFAGT
jgi:hypothetical protein